MTVVASNPDKLHRLNHAFWFRLPVRVRRFLPKFSLILTDGLYVSAWPQFGGIIPLALLFVGFFVGSLFLSPTPSEVPIYSSSLILMEVLISISSLGAAMGFWSFLGYIIGDIFILRFVRASDMASQIGKRGWADAACLIVLYGLLASLLISVPFVSYRLRQLALILPAELGKLALKFFQHRGLKMPEFMAAIGNSSKKINPVYKKWLLFPFDAALYATFFGVLSYLWTQTTPILMRSAYVWYHYPDPRSTIVNRDFISPLQDDYMALIHVGIVFGVARILLEYIASGQANFTREVKNLRAAMRDIKIRPANAAQIWVGEFIRIGLAVLLLYGILQDVNNIVITAIVLFVSTLLRRVFLPQVVLWRDFVGQFPLILRIIGVGAGSYWLSSAMMDGKLSGDTFYPVLLPLWVCLLLSTLFFPERKRSRALKVAVPQNPTEGETHS